MKNLLNRAKFVLNGEDGALSLEQIILISVALVIATALFTFGGRIIAFLTRSGQRVDQLQVQ